MWHTVIRKRGQIISKNFVYVSVICVTVIEHLCILLGVNEGVNGVHGVHEVLNLNSMKCSSL